MPSFQESIQHPYVLLDGAKGSWFIQQGHLGPGEPSSSLLLTNPRVVVALHEEYARVADIIQTHSFDLSETQQRLYTPGITDSEIRKRNQLALQLAREAIARHPRVLIAGSMGPLGRLLEPNGNLSYAGAVSAFQTQAEGLKGVDVYNPETMFDPKELEAAVEAIRSVDPDTPIMATMTFNWRNGKHVTDFGTTVQEMATLAKQLGLAALGANCGDGSDTFSALVDTLKEHAPYLPIVVKLNAGMPKLERGKTVYPQATTDWAKRYAVTVYEHGARLIGGCCGTTPELIGAMKEALDTRTSQQSTPNH